jgi:hypothetical protein
MANNKKFIVKNGLESQENVVIGTTTDDGVNKLQVTGSSKLTGAVEVTQSTAATPTVKFTNSAGPSALIAEFAGTSQSVRITNFSAGDYSILNTGQSNGIRLFNDTAGLDILYNGNTDLVFNSTGIDFKRAPTYLGNVFWNAGNDGANSGLDADLIDGLDSSQFLRSDESDTMNGSLIITGNLTVQGTTTTLSTETILLADNIITLNSNYTGSTPSENAGIEVERGTLANSTFQWLEASDKWELGGPSLGLILGDTSNRQGAITSYANSFIIEAGGASGVSSGTVLLSGRLFGTAANAGVAAFHNPTTNISYGELLYNGSPRIRSESVGVTALGNSTVQGTLTVGTGSGGAYIYLDGAGTNGTIYSSAGEIGFLNASLNYALKVDTAGDVRVTDNIYAQKFIDINNNTYQVVPSVTSVLNNIDLEGSLRHNGDTDTFITFPTTGRIGFTLDGTQYGLMTNTAFQYTGDVIADRFLDRSDNAYYVDPANSSVLNTVGIDSDLFHNGDTDTKLSFATDSITLSTANVVRLTANTTALTSSLDVYAPRYYDSNNNAFYLDPASTSELNSANFYSASANNAINVGINAAQRFNIDVTSSQGYIRYIQNEIDATDHSVNFEIISGSGGLNRFNFNKNIDVGSNTITGGFGVFTSGAYASVFYDYDNEAFFADLNNTGNSINIAGTVQAGNGTLALPSYTFGSDTNTGMYRAGVDTIGFSAGGNDEFRILTTYTLSPGSSRAPIFYDSDNTAYYGDFASTSVMNRVGIDDYIQHNGNITSYFGFSANNIFKLFTNGAERLNIDDNSADFSVDVYAPRYYDSNTITYYGDFAATSVMNRIDIDDYIRHNGNTTSYFGFSANNIYKLFTNGVERLNVDDDSADFAVNVYAPQYYTNDYLIHNGDTNTYVGFDANDQFGVWTNGVKQIAVNTTAVAINLNTNITGALDVTGRATIGNSLTRPDSLAVLANSAARIGGADVHLHVASLGAAANYAVALQSGRQSDNVSFPLVMQPNGGNVGVGTLTAGATLTVNKKTAQGNNPFAAGTSLFSLGDVDVVDYSIRTDSFGNIFHVNDNGGNQIWYTSSAGGLFAILNTGDVVVNNDSTTYAVTDAATNFIATGTASNNKLHVTGSISMGSINDVISIYGADGANTAITSATFLGVNELGFSGGGGFYMNDTATVRVRGNKAISTTGDITGARFIDAGNNTYIVDPAGTSVMNRIDIDDYIRHNGDTDNYFGFAANDTFRVFTGNAQRLNIDNDSADFTVNVYAPIFYDSDNNAYYGDFGGTSNMSRIDVDDYIRHRGNTDAYFGWAGNNNFKLFTNGTERFNIDADSADFAINVYAPRYYDSNDSTYYVDPASVSIMNNVSFGVPGNGSNVKGRFLSIEGDTDASGEGSSRIFFAEHNSTTADQDKYGMALAYRGGNAAINSVTGQPTTLTGLGNGEWGLLGYDNSISGNWAMRGPRSSAYVEARGDFRAPIFYDSNNTAYYGDFASTSIMNIVRVGQLQVDDATTFIDSRAGDYGTIRVEGTTGAGSWAGYAIRDDWVFMSNGAASAGIYNDTDNEWALEAAQNSWTRLYANGVHQLSAENGYGFAPTSMRSPIFYDSDDINYFANFAAGNANNAIKVNGRIFREGFTADSGSTNTFLLAQDENQFIWNTATNWGIFWATNTSAAYRYTPFGDNMISFVGAGNLRAAIDLDNGAAYFQGAVTAADFKINGGNEDLGILKTYGSGLGDTMMFDGTEYWEKRVIKVMQGAEANATNTTAEYVKNNNGPFASTYALRTNQYRTFDSDYIPVEPGEQIYGEIAVRYISGSGGLVYMGVRRYDKDKLAIAGNDGIEYFVVGGNNVTDTNWQTFRGHTTIPSSHTPFSGSDGGACKYVRVIVLMNYPNAGGPALREYGPPVLKRVNHLSNLVTDFDLSVGGNATITGDLTVDDITSDVIDANLFRDRSNNAYYVDPYGFTNLGRDTGTVVAITKTGASTDNTLIVTNTRGDHSYGITGEFRVEGTAGTDRPSILFSSGYNSNTWSAGFGFTDSNFRIKYDHGHRNGSWGTTSLEIDRSSNVWAYGSMRSPIFYDNDNTGYYGDFASTSNLNALNAEATTVRHLNFKGEGGDSGVGTRAYSIYQEAGAWSFPYPDLRIAFHTGIKFGANSGYQGMRFYDDYTMVTQVMSINNANDALGANNVYVNNSLQAGSSLRAPIFYDSNDTNYYGDFASTSVVNVLRANQLQLDGSTYTIDSVSDDYGSIAVNGYRNGWAGYSINNQWVFMSSGPGNAGIYNDVNNQWAILAAQTSDVQIFFNGTWEERSRSGFMEARGSYRAPIFYDSDNTAYLIDGNGTSRLLNLNVDNVIGGSVNGYSELLLSRDNRTIAPSEDPAARMRFGFTSWANNDSAPYADYLHLRSYTDASGGSDNLITFLKSGIGMRIRQQTWGSGTAYSTVRNVTIYNENPGAGNDLYASIYYDSNDTSYRVDPTDTSIIRYLKVNTAGSSSGTRALTIKSDGQAEINFGAYPGNWTSALQIQNNNNTDFVWISPLDDGQNARFRTGGSGLDIYTDGGSGDAGTYSAFIGSGSVRSSIFYDLDNTGYYLNLNGSSNHAGDFRTDQFYARGWFRNDNSGTGLYNQATAMHWYSDTSSRFRLYSTTSTSQILMATAGDVARGYVYAENDNSIGFLNNGGSWRMRIVSGDWIDVGGSSIRAPIFYDNQDTTYYVDPNSSARIATVGVGLAANNGGKLSVTGGHGDSNIRVTAQGNQLGSGVTSSMHWWVSEPGVTWNEGGFGFNVTNDGGTPSGFGRPNTSYGQGYMRYTTGGDIVVYNTNTSGTRFQNMEFLSNGTVYANNYLTGGNSLRAPIFYDSQDTGYYSDPNGGSRLNTTENIGRVGFSNYLVSRNEGGMMGSYNATGTADKVIWTIGESWPLGNMYGLAYSYGGFGPFGTQHKLVLRENGSTSTQFGFGGNMYVAGSGAAQNDFRAPIFYDSNDTAYYFDGASVNSTRFEGVSNRTKAMMGLPGRTGFSAEYYSARPRITGDVNYWTGSMGWGTIDMNDLAHWGSGFIDSWSNPGNQPSGTSHWVGTQAWHYTDNGNARYGWQLVGGPIGNLRFRQSWSGFNAWRTVPMLGVNDGNGAAMYANIYYDSDNTGYYCDPSGSSNLNLDLTTDQYYARGWFRNNNVNTGLYNQGTGSHWYSSSSQYWNATGNNNGADMNIRGLAAYQGTSRFWLHGATDGYQGFLNSNGSWLFRMSHNAGQSPGIWFYEAGESWTGNIGADVGKIEYHANRFYIVSGSNSDRIVQFRRDGSDFSYIANDGVFVGTATSARWADLAERYEADAIYEAGTVLAIGGDKEVTLYQPGMPLAGAISVKPAYRMNDENYGNDNSIESKMNPFVALKGRIPVLINGSAKKGQWIIADKDGKGRAVDYGTPGINTFDIIGIAIGDSNGGEVEVKI